jgi:hypothetical protein
LAKNRLFWFFIVGFACWQKPNVPVCAVGFLYDAQHLTISIADTYYYRNCIYPKFLGITAMRLFISSTPRKLYEISLYSRAESLRKPGIIKVSVIDEL